MPTLPRAAATQLPWLPPRSSCLPRPSGCSAKSPPSLSNAAVLRSVKSPSATPRQVVAVYSAAARQLGFHHDLPTYKALLSFLASKRRFRAIELLLARMPHDGLLPGPALLLPLVRSFSAAGRGLDALLRTCPSPLSERLLSSLIHSLALTGDHNIARSVLAAAAGLGQPLHARHYSGLVRALYDRDGVRSATEFLDLLAAKGCFPDEFFYRSLIRDICLRGGNSITAAFEVVEQMRRSGREPDLVVWNTLVQGCARQGQMSKAEQVMAEMERKSGAAMADAWTYNALISGIPDRLMSQDGILAFRRMVERGVSPDVVTFSALIGGLGRAGRVWECNAMLGKMVRLGIPPDVACYKVLVGVYRINNMPDDASAIAEAMKYDLLDSEGCKKPPKHMRSWFLNKPPTPAHPNGGTGAVDASLFNFSVPLSGGF
ncbi:hypothetical protein ZIOFF_017122 [Zingiber officinale]|uniref:Pentatricopeptide repeat-containing protein-mitochondrial domain-containing protein n=1 Tax=Zingiber officinale TaxID=94328 RepID=A0A8J5LA16_ZINOF|nr:hypothetical protein ZIOFF_017122 [Zingiber officinale]